MAKDLQIAILLDIYGDLLTDKQKDVIDLYYNEDLSLGEIAEHQGITRQGVRDSIKRGEQLLLDMENALHLYQKEKEQQAAWQEIERLAKAAQQITTMYRYDASLQQMVARIGRLAQQQSGTDQS